MNEKRQNYWNRMKSLMGGYYRRQVDAETFLKKTVTTLKVVIE
jgi:hypothetical protein